MKEYTSDSIRNIALVSHSSAGKTMMAEAFLHLTGATTRLGRIEDGTTASDFDEEEIRRQISVYTSVIPVEYQNKKINILDTPGYTDFVGDMISALSVVEGALVLVDAVSGIEVGTEVAWRYCDQFNLPRIIVINKMDRQNANYAKVFAAMEEYSDTRLIKFNLPIGEKEDYKGTIDLISMKAFLGDDTTGSEIPAEYKDDAETERMVLIEAAAEGDDSLLEKYLETGELSEDEIKLGLKNIIKEGTFIPVLVSAAGSELGVAPVLNAIADYIPSPLEAAPRKATLDDSEIELIAEDSGPVACYVWKTTADPFVGKQTFFRVLSGSVSSDSKLWNSARNIEERFGSVSVMCGNEATAVKTIHAGDIGVVPKLSETSTGNVLCNKDKLITIDMPAYPNALYRVAVFPKTQVDSTKINSALTKLCEEDMTLSWYNDPLTFQTILQGMGDQHIDVVIRRAEVKLQVGINTDIPRVPFKEAINGKGDARYRHKKQSGGSGQFGEVALRVEAFKDGDFEFKNNVFGGSVSQSYMPAIEKGIRNVMKEGTLAGYPISGIRVSVYDGKEHPVDSKPIAFEIAGRGAFKEAFLQANPILLEPIMNVKVIIPEEYMGDIMGDLNGRRGRVQGMESEKGRSTISAQVPLAEMQRYTTILRSMTGGRGIFTMEEARYEMVPSHITQEIIDQRKKDASQSKEE
ncbi:MAG: elongation factor G [Anaerolineaceae bacterium]|nr:elongation factor G [Anaerolineaceae bacterium]